MKVYYNGEQCYVSDTSPGREQVGVGWAGRTRTRRERDREQYILKCSYGITREQVRKAAESSPDSLQTLCVVGL